MRNKTNKKSTELLPLKPGIIPVDEWCGSVNDTRGKYRDWKIPEEDRIFRYSEKSISVRFEDYFGYERAHYLDNFYIIYKDSYSKKFNLITHYMNYFLKFYDHDKELLMSYFMLKYMVDLKKVDMQNRETFINLLYDELVTDTMYDKVKQMVEDNYRIDLSQDPESKIKYSEALEFTNEHAKLLMLISIFIKMMIPITMHYISLYHDKKETHKLIKYYKRLFDVVEKKEHVNLYAKLYTSISVKVNLSETKNKRIWDKYEVDSSDAATYTDDLLDKNTIVDNIFKYRFDDNIIAFNSVILRTQLNFFFFLNLNINVNEISTEKDSDGLSTLDKLEMNATKIDENIILLSKINIKKTIKTLKKRMNIELSKEEVDFYMRHLKVSHITKTLVFYFYAKYFGGYRDLNMINLRLFMKLLILMKKEMGLRGYVYLNQIISSNVDGKINTRVIHNAKFLEKIKTSSVYQNLVQNKYSSLGKSSKGDVIISLLSTLINTQFTIVDYDNPRELGKPLQVNLDTLSQEFLDFVNLI